MTIKYCEKCKQLIGKLEESFVHQGHIICKKCKYIIDKENHVICKSKSSNEMPEEVVEINPNINILNLLELKPLKFILFSILIAIGIWFAEFIFNLLLKKVLEELSSLQWLIVGLIFCFSISISIAGVIYGIRKSWLMLLIAAIVLVLFRFIFAAFYFNISLAGYIILYALGEVLVISLVALGIISLFKIADKKFQYAKLRDIKCDVEIGESKTKYDIGVCCNCGNITKIAKKNSFLDFLPKKEFHFCDNCGLFLRNNPVVSTFFGISEIIFSSLLLIGLAASIDTQRQSSTQSIGLLFALCGVLDGLRRGFSGIKGLVISRHK